MIRLLFITILIALFLPACRLPGPELTPEEKDIVDTLYNAKLKLMRIELDSICALQHDSLRDRAVDSLVELQLKDIKKLVNRE